jgi:hypothetical protein
MNTTGDTKTSLRPTESCKVAVVQAPPSRSIYSEASKRPRPSPAKLLRKVRNLSRFPRHFFPLIRADLISVPSSAHVPTRGARIFFAIGRAAWMCPDLP